MLPTSDPAILFMGGKRSAIALAVLLLFGQRAVLCAQQMGEYSVAYLPDGTPQFTQTLRWNGDANVLFYDVTVQTAAGETISTVRLDEPVLSLHLGPGEYSYRIVLFNLLGKQDLELPWQSFTVLEAKKPQVDDSARKEVLLENYKPEITLSGTDLEPGAAVELSNLKHPESSIVGKAVHRTGDTGVHVEFPVNHLPAGTYSVSYTNPGGLSLDQPGLIIVRYPREIEILTCGGYSPWISLYGSWYKETWPGTFFPLSATSRGSFFFFKRSFGSLGAELNVTGRLIKGGIDAAILNTDIVQTGLSAVYKHPFSQRGSITARLGGGVSRSHHKFSYENSTGSEITSMDLFISSGLSFEYFPVKRFFLEGGIDWAHMFLNGFSSGGIMPYFLMGTLF